MKTFSSFQTVISPCILCQPGRSGYFDLKELATFRKLNSRLQGHPATAEHLPGIRIASGPLGQGMRAAIIGRRWQRNNIGVLLSRY